MPLLLGAWPNQILQFALMRAYLVAVRGFHFELANYQKVILAPFKLFKELVLINFWCQTKAWTDNTEPIIVSILYEYCRNIVQILFIYHPFFLSFYQPDIAQIIDYVLSQYCIHIAGIFAKYCQNIVQILSSNLPNINRISSKYCQIECLYIVKLFHM